MNEENIELPEVVINADKQKSNFLCLVVGSLALYGTYKLFSKWVR